MSVNISHNPTQIALQHYFKTPWLVEKGSKKRKDGEEKRN